MKRRMHLARAESPVLAGLYLQAVRQLADKMIREGVHPKIAEEKAPDLLAIGELRRLGLLQ